jgi:hypothetical protein
MTMPSGELARDIRPFADWLENFRFATNMVIQSDNVVTARVGAIPP